MRSQREQKRWARTYVDLVERVSPREVAENPRLVKVDELGHVVDAPNVGIRVPRQDLPAIHHSLPMPQPSHKLSQPNPPPGNSTNTSAAGHARGIRSNESGRCALTLTPVDRTTVIDEDGEAGEEATSASAQARSGCSTHTAVPGRKIIAAAAARRRRWRWRCGL